MASVRRSSSSRRELAALAGASLLRGQYLPLHGVDFVDIVIACSGSSSPKPYIIALVLDADGLLLQHVASSSGASSSSSSSSTLLRFVSGVDNDASETVLRFRPPPVTSDDAARCCLLLAVHAVDAAFVVRGQVARAPLAAHRAALSDSVRLSSSARLLLSASGGVRVDDAAAASLMVVGALEFHRSSTATAAWVIRAIGTRVTTLLQATQATPTALLSAVHHYRRSPRTLRVLVEAGRTLPKCDISGKADPYVCVIYDGELRRTETVKRTLTPTFATPAFAFNVWVVDDGDDATPPTLGPLTIDVYDWDRGKSDDHIGSAVLMLSDVLKRAPSHKPTEAELARLAATGQRSLSEAAVTYSFSDWVKLEKVGEIKLTVEFK